MRHERPVAVIVAHEDFERMKKAAAGAHRSFRAVLEWRNKYAGDLENLDVAGALSGTRAQRSARGVKW